jgi:flagellar biosynthetic protein FlhB
MADSDGQERTEEATPRRLRQAREKGQIPRSRELGTAAVLISSALLLLMTGAALGRAMIQLFSLAFTQQRDALFDPSRMGFQFLECIRTVAPSLLIFIGSLFVAALVGNILLGGLAFSAEAAMPKFSKLNPLNGLKRMFGIQSWVELLKSIAKVALIGGCAWFLLMANGDTILSLSGLKLQDGVRQMLTVTARMFLLICTSLLLIVLIDVPFQRWNHAKQLKMTRQEIKDEFKDSDGRPEVKQRIRRMQMEMANRRMMSNVPKADVIVTNPTHFAVALQYRAGQAGAPVLLAKGVDQIALKIREIGNEYRLPVISSPLLARAIYHTTDLDSEIPEGLYAAVAQVLAYVYQLNQYRKGLVKRPRALSQQLPIPEEMRHY